jgi:hypothetical protein
MWPDDHGLFRSDRDRALGWLAVEGRGPDAALDVLQAGADNARRRGAFALEAMLLHDAVRFGRAAAVTHRLHELASVVQGELSVARADHAAGVVGRDLSRLTAAVDAFERVGSPLLAAEAALDLVDASVALRDRAGAGDAASRAERLRAQLHSGVVTPRLRREAGRPALRPGRS